MSRYLSRLAALTLNRLEPLLPRQMSRFETPIDIVPYDNKGLDTFQDALPAYRQTSMARTTDPSTMAQKSVIAPVDRPAKKESGKQDPAKIVEPSELIINPSELNGAWPKPSPVQGVASSDVKPDVKPNTRQSTSTIQPVDKPVAPTPTAYGIRKEALPTENSYALIDRIQERFTETRRSELIIKEAASPDANQKTSKPGELPHPTPVKPSSIIVRPEQSTAGQHTRDQAAPPATATTPAPTVQVTIGRIEIRATQVTDKPVLKTRVNTAMSLDDYLKQRNGGRA
ncbi:MAG: hypothetical protein PSV18_06370 [Methylobacter sp.]|uniref:Uncharacterized protein n=1 Tax=Candidatus Methylobacter titanis TaxID=3053457 RepID=A0AA43TND6_9GAMM|nr:hypothetical protein [Candidatus Methylobacter titanis]MDI1292353.1 hypothetical protein [Candidatus Methylobacter titanis]